MKKKFNHVNSIYISEYRKTTYFSVSDAYKTRVPNVGPKKDWASHLL